MTDTMLGVCWPAPACPTTIHATGDHDTALAVLLRVETFAVEENAAALSVA